MSAHHPLPGQPLHALGRYQRLLREHGWSEDPAQRHALELLDGLRETLIARLRRRPAWQQPLQRLLRRRPAGRPAQGLYLWGGVGRGKTLVMDLFFQSLPFEHKQRTHFHRFMNAVHEHLRTLEDRPDPLEAVADGIAARHRVLCFDEFFVSDIADAMILGTLLDALFRREVTLVATSNLAPDDLYRDGLQRARFLPAIALLNEHTRVVHLDGGIDYRLRLLARASVYLTPAGADADRRLAQSFADMAGTDESEAQELAVLGRSVPVRRAAAGVAWFDFAALCDGPRSAADYVEIARCHHTVLVSGVPQFDATLDNPARRFISLVDEFYDRRVKLLVSAAAPPQSLYRGHRLAFEFQRTASRLQAMQSHAYLAAAHRP